MAVSEVDGKADHSDSFQVWEELVIGESHDCIVEFVSAQTVIGMNLKLN